MSTYFKQDSILVMFINIFVQLADYPDNKRKEIFYLITYSTHFIYGYYDTRHAVKDHSETETMREKKPAATLHVLLLLLIRGASCGYGVVFSHGVMGRWIDPSR